MNSCNYSCCSGTAVFEESVFRGQELSVLYSDCCILYLKKGFYEYLNCYHSLKESVRRTQGIPLCSLWFHVFTLFFINLTVFKQLCPCVPELCWIPGALIVFNQQERDEIFYTCFDYNKTSWGVKKIKKLTYLEKVSNFRLRVCMYYFESFFICHCHSRMFLAGIHTAWYSWIPDNYIRGWQTALF